MMEDVANEATSSHEFVNANEQMQLAVVIPKGTLTNKCSNNRKARVKVVSICSLQSSHMSTLIFYLLIHWHGHSLTLREWVRFFWPILFFTIH